MILLNSMQLSLVVLHYVYYPNFDIGYLAIDHFMGSYKSLNS